MYKGLIPFSLTGQPIDWVSKKPPKEPGIHEGIEWRPNIPFAARLSLKKYSRGRSSVQFVWESDHGIRYDMSLADGFALIPYLKNMMFEGTFAFAKRGQNYLLEPIFD
jgi:hypothetical protein